MKNHLFRALLMVLIVGLVGSAQAYLDNFDGTDLDAGWTVRDPAGKAEYQLDGGKLILDLQAEADMYIQGVDAGVMFLMDPPEFDDFSVEMHVNAAVAGEQPPACQVGIVFFREDTWVYSAWGPYNAGQDIRLEDCVGESYRWRDQTLIGVDVSDVAVDSDVFLRVVKTGDELEFFAAGDGPEGWVSGGVDTLVGPNFEPGTYQIGIIAKSWGGSVDGTFEFDFFDIPGSGTAVEPEAKLATTWAGLK